MSTSPNKLLSVVIISYNTQDLTLQAVKSVIADVKRSPSLRQKTELIVVDNDSEDKTVADLKQLSPQELELKLITNHQNKGFAQANNQAINRAEGNYILLLNSDTIVQPGALNQLISSFQSTEEDLKTAGLSSQVGKLDHLGILAATLTNPDRSIQPQGGSFPNLITVGLHFLMLDDLPLIGHLLPSTQDTGFHFHPKQILNRYQPYQKDWVGGTAMMVKQEVFAEVGQLDPNIFMYGEDMEFCLRAKNHHWDIAVDPQAKITHLGSASSSSQQALLGEIKGYLYLWAKHKPDWQLYPLKILIWLGCVMRLFLFAVILNQKKKAKVYQKALTLLD
jgi:hypothetical protein